MNIVGSPLPLVPITSWMRQDLRIVGEPNSEAQCPPEIVQVSPPRLG